MPIKGYPPSVTPGIPNVKDVPETWRIFNFGEVFEKIDRKADLQDETEYQLIVAKRNRGGIEPREKLKGKEIKTKTQYFTRTDDFVISKRQIVHGSCGIVPHTLDGSIVSNEYLTLKPVSNLLDLGFLEYLPHSVIFQQSTFQASVGVDIEKMIFRWNDFVKFKVPLPLLEEQKKIAEILSTWDEAIEAVEELIEEKKRLFNKLLSTFFDNTLNYKKSKLKNLGTFSKGKGISKSETQNKGIPCVRYGELYTEYTTSITSTVSFISNERASNSTKIKLGDILFAGSGETNIEIGKSAIYLLEEGYAGGDIIIFSPDLTKIDSRYLSFQLASPYQIKQRARLAQGHSVVHIYRSHLENIDIIVPDYKQQKKHASILEDVEATIQLLVKKKKLLKKQKRGLMQRLLSGKVRVN